jgi:hypothetical protein
MRVEYVTEGGDEREVDTAALVPASWWPIVAAAQEVFDEHGPIDERRRLWWYRSADPLWRRLGEVLIPIDEARP